MHYIGFKALEKITEILSMVVRVRLIVRIGAERVELRDSVVEGLLRELRLAQLGVAQLQDVVTLQLLDLVHADLDRGAAAGALDLGAAVGAGEADRARVLAPELEPAQGHLQPGGGVGVAEEGVAHAQREVVGIPQRAGKRGAHATAPARGVVVVNAACPWRVAAMFLVRMQAPFEG